MGGSEKGLKQVREGQNDGLDLNSSGKAYKTMENHRKGVKMIKKGSKRVKKVEKGSKSRLWKGMVWFWSFLAIFRVRGGGP